RCRRQPVTGKRRADAGAAPGEFLLDQRAIEKSQARAAVLGRQMAVHKPQLPRLLDDLAWPRAVLVVLPCDRADLVLGEVVRHLAHVLLLVGEREINHLATP